MHVIELKGTNTNSLFFKHNQCMLPELATS